MKKNWHRLLLDLVLLVGLATFYNYRLISMSYHEIGGLVLFGLFVLHLIFNHKWIKSIFVKLFSSKIPMRTRIMGLLDVLLLLSWAMVIVSGAFISKVVFSFRIMGNWKILHFFFAALSLILSGVHLGFHVKYLGINLKKILPIPLPELVKKILIVTLSVVILVLGVMNFTDSSMRRWLSAPFETAAMGGPSGEMGRGGASGEIEAAAAGSQNEPRHASGELASGEMAKAGAASGGPGQPRPSGEMGMNISLSRVLTLVWQFGSVVLAVMTVTGWVDYLYLWAKGRIRAGKKANPQEK